MQVRGLKILTENDLLVLLYDQANQDTYLATLDMNKGNIYYTKTLPMMTGPFQSRATFIGKDYLVASNGKLFNTNMIPS